MIRVAVVGVGHFGREHARVYSTSLGVMLAGVCDKNPERAALVAAEFKVQPFTDVSELIGKVDAVSLAVPTVEHHSIAAQFLGAGIAVLVEKPMARTLEEADDLIAISEKSGSVLQVGHLERFNPAVTAARKIASNPRFFEAHRLSVFTPRSLDVDVVMDLMIHDIDVVLSFVESEVVEIRAAGIPVITPQVDIANARIEFENGTVANLTASRVSGDRVRKLRFFQPNQYVSVDYASQEAFTVSVQRGQGPIPAFNAGALPVEKGEPLRLEIESFISAVGGAKVEVDGRAGRRALALALEVSHKISEHFKKLKDVY